MKKRYKYIWKDHTMARLKEWEEKIRIEENEIVESNIEEGYFLHNDFIEVKMEDKVEKKVKKVKPKK
jgi:hypothetical protein